MTLKELRDAVQAAIDAGISPDLPVCVWVEERGWWHHFAEFATPEGVDGIIVPVLEIGEPFDSREL